MSQYRFDDRVAVVTGAGRGIGRAYAHLLAELGAKVVVNDLGGAMDGTGSDTGPAQKAADEINAAGGVAVADTSDVSVADGGTAPVALAIKQFGRIDIVVNNAGNIKFGGLPDVEIATIESHLNVHVKGAFNTTRAAWPHMVEQNYGRVVHTTSTGMFGMPDNLGYATAKAAILGMTHSMTQSAGSANIKVNAISPNAVTRMAGGESGDVTQRWGEKPLLSPMDPELVAPMVGYLAHEACDVSGEVFVAGAGRFAQLFVGVTDGYLPDDAHKTGIGDIADNLGRIKDRSNYYVPTSLMNCVEHYTAHFSG